MSACGHALAALPGGCPSCRGVAARLAPAPAARPTAYSVPSAACNVSPAGCGHLLARVAGGCPSCRTTPPTRELAAPPPERAPIPITLDQIVAERSRRSLAYYVRHQWERTLLASTLLEWGPHLDAICDHIQGQLEDAERKRRDPLITVRAQNLLINCPPRCLKTLLLTLANAWAWIRWPWMQILYLSANEGVVLDSARLFRDVVCGDWYQRLFVKGKWKIRDDQDALKSIGNTAGGARRARTMGSDIIGLNADWLCADDAHSMDDSAEEIAKTCENYDGNISSRMNDPRTGIRTAIMQRCRRGDFSEHVLDHGWFHLRMPMEYERRPECRCAQCELAAAGLPNAFGWRDWRTEEGERLHPRFTSEYLAERRRTLRAHGYAGQMQQRPAPKEGNQFKLDNWRYFQINGGRHGAADGAPRSRPLGISAERQREPAFVLQWDDRYDRLAVDWVEVSIDPTGGSENKDASALGIEIIIGLGERRMVLEDLTPGPQGWTAALGHARRAVARASDLTGWVGKIVVRIEHKALGQGMLEDLRKAVADGAVVNARGETVLATIKPCEPTGKGDKSQRAEFMEPMHEAGLMFLLDGAAWLTRPPTGSDQTLVDEVAAFPDGRRDDRIDCLSQCLHEHRTKRVSWVSLFSGSKTGAPVSA